MRIHITRSIIGAITALLAISGYAANAPAQCGTSPRQNINIIRGAAAAKPLMTTQELKLRDDNMPGENGGNVTGLWDVTFTVNGNLFDEIFDQYHQDGNEVAMDIVPPVTGNVCLGVWQRSGGGRYHLSHYYWVFDPETNTVLIGRGHITMDFSLGKRGNTMSGTFTVQVRDQNGQPISGFDDVAGQLTGVRLQ